MLSAVVNPCRAIYTKEDNTTLLVEGDTIRRPQLAQTLGLLSEDPEQFYTGDMAQRIVDDLAAHGGRLGRISCVMFFCRKVPTQHPSPHKQPLLFEGSYC